MSPAHDRRVSVRDSHHHREVRLAAGTRLKMRQKLEVNKYTRNLCVVSPTFYTARKQQQQQPGDRHKREREKGGGMEKEAQVII